MWSEWGRLQVNHTRSTGDFFSKGGTVNSLEFSIKRSLLLLGGIKASGVTYLIVLAEVEVEKWLLRKSLSRRTNYLCHCWYLCQTDFVLCFLSVLNLQHVNFCGREALRRVVTAKPRGTLCLLTPHLSHWHVSSHSCSRASATHLHGETPVLGLAVVEEVGRRLSSRCCWFGAHRAGVMRWRAQSVRGQAWRRRNTITQHLQMHRWVTNKKEPMVCWVTTSFQNSLNDHQWRRFSMSFKCAGWGILLPLCRDRLAVSPVCCLYAKLSKPAACSVLGLMAATAKPHVDCRDCSFDCTCFHLQVSDLSWDCW